MKKIIVATLILCCSFSGVGHSDAKIQQATVRQAVLGASTKLAALQSYGTLTFFKDFENSQASLNADYSAGSATATYAVTRSASTPATYFNSSGVMITETTTAPRYTKGFYDALGWHLGGGLLIEQAATNLVPDSADMSAASWTVTNATVTANTTTSPDSGVNADTLTATAANGTMLLTSAVSSKTFSVFIKRKTGTGNIQITSNSGTAWTTVTLPESGWGYFVSPQETSTSQTCGVRIVTSGDEVYVWGAQFETTGDYSTTYIPTSGGSVTRNKETIKYANTSNRTKASESIFLKIKPLVGSTNILNSKHFIASETKNRLIDGPQNTGVFRAFANITDSSSSAVGDITGWTQNQSTVVAATFQHRSPYVAGYKDGISRGTNDTADDFTDPNWGTSFFIGSDLLGNNGSSFVIQALAIYSDVKHPADVYAISRALGQPFKLLLEDGDSALITETGTEPKILLEDQIS